MLDVRVIETDAPSYESCVLKTDFASAVVEKTEELWKIIKAILHHLRCLLMVYCIVKSNTSLAVYVLNSLADRWDKSYSETICYA